MVAPHDERLGPLPHDIPPEPDPGPPPQLQVEPRRLGDRLTEPLPEPWRLEEDEEELRPSGERADPPQLLRGRGRSRPPPITRAARSYGRPPGRGRQVDDEEVEHPLVKKRGRHRKGLVERTGPQDDELAQVDPTRRGLNRIERPRRVEIAGKEARGLRLGDQPERERRAPARRAAAERNRPRVRDRTRSEDCVKLREPAREPARHHPDIGFGVLRGERRERADDLEPGPGRSAPPPRAKRGDGVEQILRGGRHAVNHRTYVL